MRPGLRTGPISRSRGRGRRAGSSRKRSAQTASGARAAPTPSTGLPDGRTRISFELEWLEAARLERLFGPLTRVFVHRANAKSMRRLVKLLEQ